MSYWAICNDCDEEVEPLRVPDGPSVCPECLSVDNFRELEEEDLCSKFEEFIEERKA